MKDKTMNRLLITAFVSVIVGLILFFTLIGPYMEARTFNKLTGANVSTWDAIWVNLRVDIPVKDGK